MKNLILFLGLTLILFACHLPQSIYDDFEGEFVYSLSTPGHDVDPNDSTSFQVIYAKNSMLRIDNFTVIGKQTFLKQIASDTAYLLMNLGDRKVALQTIFDSTKTDNNYRFDYKSGSKTFAGIKSKNINVYDKELDTTIVMNYYPKISSKYSMALEGMPGLPVNYSIPNKGQWIHYQLSDIQEKPLDDAVFIIPSDYEIMTIDEFMEIIQNN